MIPDVSFRIAKFGHTAEKKKKLVNLDFAIKGTVMFLELSPKCLKPFESKLRYRIHHWKTLLLFEVLLSICEGLFKPQLCINSVW